MTHRNSVWIDIVDSPIDVNALHGKLDDPDAGAQGWFFGVTRRTTGDRVTASLSYQAHREMAIAELEKIAKVAIEKFGIRRLVIVHQLGDVPVGQCSVVVACSTSHRTQTFAAMAWIMDVLKRDVPIWKKETFVDGSTQWVHPITQPET